MTSMVCLQTIHRQGPGKPAVWNFQNANYSASFPFADHFAPEKGFDHTMRHTVLSSPLFVAVLTLSIFMTIGTVSAKGIAIEIPQCLQDDPVTTCKMIPEKESKKPVKVAIAL